MSTPTGKPHDPIDLTSYVSHRARASGTRRPGEDAEPPPISPYAPKRSQAAAGLDLSAGAREAQEPSPHALTEPHSGARDERLSFDPGALPTNDPPLQPAAASGHD